MNLSPEQRAAVERTGQDVCVVAGPGSGKTRVLIERFAWLVEREQIDPGRILAVTFTEKAATEIKERLIRRFACDPSLRQQMERAWVSTIHGFCTRLLKENAIRAGIDPDFIVLDQGVQQALLRQVIEEVLNRCLVETPDRLRALLAALKFSTRRNTDAPDLADTLAQVLEALRVAGTRPSQVQLPAPRFSAFRQILDHAQQVLRGSPEQGLSERQAAAVEQLRAAAQGLLEITPQFFGPQDIQLRHFEALEAFEGINLNHLKRSSRERDCASEIKKELLKAARAELATAYFDPQRQLIRELLAAAAEAFRQEKRRRSAVDFGDLELYTVELLEGDAELREQIRSQFDYILMDELQDTNPIQWRLINLLRRPSRFFAVGDMNQSIYGFRHAEPEVFRSFRESLQGQVDHLRRNYRSRPEILQVINQLFAQDCPGVDEPHLVAERPFSPEAGPLVEWIVVQPPAAPADEDEDEPGGREIEATAIANRIIHLTESGVPLNDIAVLTRTHEAMRPFQLAFDRANIPWVVAGGRTFFRTREVLDLILLLRILVNPCDEIALAGVLRSPLAGLTDETLFLLAYPDGLLTGIRTCLRSQEPPLEEEQRQRLQAFWQELEAAREARHTVGAHRLLRRFLDASAYEVGLRPRARANLDKFLTLIENLQSAQRLSLPDLLTYFEHAAPEAEAPPAEEDAVLFLTVHQAKGLEFPIVFLGSIDRPTRLDGPVLSYSAQDGLGGRWRHPASGQGLPDWAYLRWAETNKEKQEKEENRLLYVAATRAQERLILSGCAKKSGWAKLLEERLAPTCTLERRPEPLSLPLRQETFQLQFLAPPALSEQHDAVITASSVAVFAHCPRRYFLARFVGWEPRDWRPRPAGGEEDLEIADELDATALGTQVHALLAGAAAPDLSPQARQLAERFSHSPLARRLQAARRSGRESEFLVPMEGVLLAGQIDAWFEDAAGLTVIDYKTDNVAQPAPPDLLQPYGIQLQLYALALMQQLRRPVREAWLYFLRTEEAAPVDLSPLALEGARETLRQLIRAQQSLDFPLRPGAHCYRCPFYGRACPGQKAERAVPASAQAKSGD